MAYLLDANVFIAAKNLHYGFDFCPAFWDWLIRENQAGRVFSIERVQDELATVEDPLAEWAGQRADGFFLPLEEAALPALGAVAEWVNGHASYTPAAKSTFLQLADYYLVAQALAGGHVVVTHEQPASSVHRVKIPNVCLGLKIKCMNPYGMLRKERARFVLAPRPTRTGA
jgi:hypothetical protein